MDAERAAEAEEVVTRYCKAARLGPVQTEALLLHLCDGMTTGQVRLKLKLKRAKDARALIESGLARLIPLSGFREALRHIVKASQWQRVAVREERDLTLDEAMRGPRPAQAQTPQIGQTWIEVCWLPGTPKREGVPVLMAETVHRWW
jgi:hypothetical protein